VYDWFTFREKKEWFHAIPYALICFILFGDDIELINFDVHGDRPFYVKPYKRAATKRM